MPQLLAVLFGLALAYVNAVPVNLMIRYGVKLWERNEFHNANYILKLIIAVTVCSYHDGISFIALADLTLMGMWLWLSFDIFLNMFIHHEWDYIGTTSKIDFWLTNKFRKRAGELKALACIVVIVGINILRCYL